MTNPLQLYMLNGTYVGSYFNIPYKFTGYSIDLQNTTKYYKDGRWSREDGPAIIQNNGTKNWLINDELHRIGGPAVESCLGGSYNSYYINGEKVTEEQHDLLYSIMRLKGLL